MLLQAFLYNNRMKQLTKKLQRLLCKPKDIQQLRTLLEQAKTNKIISQEALQMIEGVLEVTKMQVRDIMVPRPQMIVVDIDDNLEKILPIIIESGHSRFPVIHESRDKVFGLLLAKDLLSYAFRRPDGRIFKTQDVLRPATFIPESKRLNILLKEFRLSHNHIAIVVDEYGGVSGLITIEDVLEEIVGEIEDEFDVDEDANIKKIYDNHYTIKALTPIEEFNQHFNSKLDDTAFDTIGGLVTREFAHLPKRGEKASIENFHFKVLHADSRRIRLLSLKTDVNEK
ncbi:MAG: CBS domain-containing protein [Gammaproteobacteria bacterium]|nr:CBS domain-containing protein [Gammaproteobacteria bacterium]